MSTPVRGHARVDMGVGGGVGWGGMLTFIATATTQYVLLHFHTYVMLRCCTSTHMSCYAAALSLALPHICHATSQNSLLCWWLQSLEKSLQTTSARKTPQMAKLCPQPRWVCEALGRKPTKKSSSLVGTQTLDRQWDWLKTRFPGSRIHIIKYKDCRQDFRKKWKYLYAAVWRKSVKGNVLNNLGQL